MAAESGSVTQSSSESIAQKIGLFRVPGLLVKLSTKCLLELDAVRSPTSPLDLKFFSNFGTRSPRSPFFDGNQNQKILLGDRVGLGLVDSLSDESTTPLGSRKVLLGSEMRTSSNLTSKNNSIVPVQVGLQEMAPETGGVDQKDENSDNFLGSGIDVFSDGLKSSFMSIDEIVNSEDYTCVVSRGPNPRTTHIFGDCIFEDRGDQLTLDEKKHKEGSVLHPKRDMMSFCCFCNEQLKEGKDIYIYQGDKAFCSIECRENFMEDEPVMDDYVVYCSSSFDKDCLFQLIE